MNIFISSNKALCELQHHYIEVALFSNLLKTLPTINLKYSERKETKEIDSCGVASVSWPRDQTRVIVFHFIFTKCTAGRYNPWFMGKDTETQRG